MPIRPVSGWPRLRSRRAPTPGVSVALGALALLLFTALPADRVAALPSRDRSAGVDCVPGNLLTRARLVDSLDASGSMAVITDGAVLPEGAPFRGSQAVEFLTAAGALTYDLGSDMPIAAASVQADAFHTFSLQVSEDGREFREIWSVPATNQYGTGMRTRAKLFWNVRARYVRFGEAPGLGRRAFTELQVFCDIPAPWPPHPAVVPPAEAPPAKPRPWFQATRHDANAIKMLLAFAGAMLLLWGYLLRRNGAPERDRRLRDALLIALGILSLTGYYNWGLYHFPARVHTYEFFHYYVGSKYFPELGYTGIYACANLAEAEQGFRRRVEHRKIRDLARTSWCRRATSSTTRRASSAGSPVHSPPHAGNRSRRTSPTSATGPGS